MSGGLSDYKPLSLIHHSDLKGNYSEKGKKSK